MGPCGVDGFLYRDRGRRAMAGEGVLAACHVRGIYNGLATNRRFLLPDSLQNVLLLKVGCLRDQ